MSTYADSAPYNISTESTEVIPPISSNSNKVLVKNKTKKASISVSKPQLSSEAHKNNSTLVKDRPSIINSEPMYNQDKRLLQQQPIVEPSSKAFDQVSSLISKFKEKTLYFSQMTPAILQDITPKLKILKGLKLNVDPGEGQIFSGNIIFSSAENTQRAFAVLNGYINSKAYNFNLSVDKNVSFSPPQTDTLRIDQLPDETEVTSLYDLLRVIGPIVSIHFTKQPESKLNNYGYVQYFEENSADNAIAELTYTEYMNNLMQLRASTRSRKSDIGASNCTNPTVTDTKTSAQQNTLLNKKPDQNSRNITQPTLPKAEKQSSIQNKQPTNKDDKSFATDHDIQQPISPNLEKEVDQTHFGLGGVLVPGKLFVRNLDSTVSHSDLFELFKKFGYIHSARVNIDPITKTSLCHGVVQMGSPEHAKKALENLNEVELKGKKINIFLYEHIPKDCTELPDSAKKTNLANNRRLSNKSDLQHSPARKEHNNLHPSESIHSLNANQTHTKGYTLSPPKQNNTNLENGLATISISSEKNDTIKTPTKTKSSNKSSTSTPGSIFDPSVLSNLSKPSYVEILSKKIISEAIDNPVLDKSFAPEIITYLVSLPIDRVLNIINNYDVLNYEWNSAQGKFNLNDLDPQTLNIVCSSWAKSNTIESLSFNSNSNNQTSPIFADSTVSPDAKKNLNNLKGYDEESEEYINLLLSKPESERKQKLGARLFPLIKGLGFQNPTKLTVWILENMLNDLKYLVYAMNDSIQLQQILKEAAAKMDQE
ncbi:hypothetical protein BB561_003874 [Smittium simulii]|uniref:RRM domain-containing protein n=1 Tax=Smittium simulii TaxID=133385 RepID=A0A2T9YJ41_9FUNG|nr:hypothetical protein BB561_003874 [Smittium simulii]